MLGQLAKIAAYIHLARSFMLQMCQNVLWPVLDDYQDAPVLNGPYPVAARES